MKLSDTKNKWFIKKCLKSIITPILKEVDTKFTILNPPLCFAKLWIVTNPNDPINIIKTCIKNFIISEPSSMPNASEMQRSKANT